MRSSAGSSEHPDRAGGRTSCALPGAKPDRRPSRRFSFTQRTPTELAPTPVPPLPTPPADVEADQLEQQLDDLESAESASDDFPDLP